MIISPILMGDDMEQCIFSSIDSSSAEKVSTLDPLYEKVAHQYDALFLDAAKIAVPGCDKIHMTAESHLALADALSKIIKTWKQTM